MSQTIPNQAPTLPGQNFQQLRDEGQATIARLAGDTWSDHNLHDPGITLMEAGAFAITDLSYRLNFPVADLMAQPEGERPLQPWWQPEQALACAALTTDDLRRVVLDMPGVHNVQVQPDPDNPALWQIRVIAREDAPADLAEQVRRRYLAQRNLGEDLSSVLVLPRLPLSLKLSLTLADGADTADSLADILVSLADIIAPGVSFQSCQQMRDQGYSEDELCTGPWLEQGFISDDQLARPALHGELYLSELISAVTLDERVEALEQLQLSVDSSNPDQWQSWSIKLTDDQAPQLNLDDTLAHLSVIKAGISVQVPAQRVRQLYSQRRLQHNVPGRPGMLSDTGRYRHPGQYLSLQQELPAIYGTGRNGIAPGESAERVAQIEQLQAWLLLLDQPLANQFAQLDRARHLLSLPDGEALAPLLALLEKMLASLSLTDDDISQFWRALAQLPPSHCSQPVQGVHSLSAILGEHHQDYQGEALQQLTELPFSPAQLERGDRVLQHLLARHHEQVPDRAILKYEELFQHYSARLLNHPEADRRHSEDSLTVALAGLKNLLDRAAFLLDLPSAAGGRGQGGDYLSHPVRNPDSISGLRHRIYRRLGLPRVAMNSLATHNGEGFHLVEGILLRHASAPAAQPDEVFILVPDWPSRFANPDFAQLFVDTLHQEMPMHLQPRLLWLNRGAMADFERLHNGWLNALSVQPAYPDSGGPCAGRSGRLTQLSDYLDTFIQHSLGGGTPDTSGWDISLPTLGEHTPENIEVQCYTVGYDPVPALSYDPQTNDDGVIGKVRINPADPATDPLIVRIRPPYPTRDKD